MDKTVGALRQLFERLYREQQGAWYPRRRGRKPSAQAQEVWEQLINTWWWPIEEGDFEYWFPVSSDELHVDFSQRRRVLYLPPLEKDAEFVPVLDMKCDVDESGAEIKLRVMLVRRTEDHGKDEGARLVGIGFRLESPYRDEDEGDDTERDGEQVEGRHDFYHAQLIQGFGWGPPIECPSWLPCQQPSFPLTADCPITLVLCLLLTLYGKRYSWELISTDAGLYNWLRQYIDKIQPWIRWKALERR